MVSGQASQGQQKERTSFGLVWSGKPKTKERDTEIGKAKFVAPEDRHAGSGMRIQGVKNYSEARS